MEYFHLGIFVIPRVYQIRKYGSQTQGFFFIFHRLFDTVHKWGKKRGPTFCSKTYKSDVIVKKNNISEF